MSRQRFPCRDRDGQDKRLGVTIKFGLRQGISCCDRVFYVATEFGQDQGFFLSRQGIFMSLCHDKIFLCRDKVLAKTKGFLVAIECF